MTRLDHNRATAQIALKAGVTVENVKNMIIWGNHSSTQFPDAKHAKVTRGFADSICGSLNCCSLILGGSEIDAYSAVNDTTWIQGDFISVTALDPL